MMKCEHCATEMNGSTVTCQSCGHNHVLQRIDAWRERRNHRLSAFNQSHQGHPAPSNKTNLAVERVQITSPKANAKDATLLRFPKKPAPPPEPVVAVPEWRNRLNAKLREIREQRALEVEPPAPPPPPEESKEDRNPRIAAALNRIRRAEYLQPITPPPRSRLAVATQLALEPSLELPASPVEVVAEAKAAPAPAPMQHTTIIPIHQLRAESVLEVDLESGVIEEDLLSEIVLESPPTAPPSTLEAASLAKRAAAAVIDAEIIAASLLPLIGAYFFLGGWFELPLLFVPITVSVLLITLYFFLTYAMAGRTMGMAWCNLHLACHTTDALKNSAPTTVTFSFQQVALRALGGTISFLLFPLNILYIANHDERLSISDRLSGMQVVRIKK
jgi:uncharacterized RDD family membrane protein YckC